MKAFGNETRPGQLRFYGSAMATFSDGGTLLCEAPPGVGKTAAYLNAIVDSGQSPVVIAVHRRALQDQIISDCQRFFPGAKAVVIKGHDAYGCGLNLPDWARGELPKDLDHVTRGKVSSSKCIKVGDCYARAAKTAAWAADIVVCTHTMLCVDLRLRELTQGAACVLPDHRYLVIDEAHTLFWEAINMMSHKVTPRSFMKEEETCLDWLRGLGQRVFHSAPDGVDNVVAAVESREYYRLYEKAVSESDDVDMVGAQLIAQHGEATYRTILREHSRTESLITALESIGSEGNVSWSHDNGVDVKPKECHSLTRKLFEKKGVIACSATLPFKMFKKEHAIKEATELQVESSFDRSRVRIVIKGPHPTKLRHAHTKLLGDSLQYLAREGGNFLVLCTSYDQVRAAQGALARTATDGLQVVCQAPGEPLPDFPDGGVLIACDSAWAGFDRKGLRAVVICGVPFMPPDPWVNELLHDLGWPWYNAQARTKLIQGIGRLQRSATDSGLVLILDDRAKRLVKAS